VAGPEVGVVRVLLTKSTIGRVLEPIGSFLEQWMGRLMDFDSPMYLIVFVREFLVVKVGLEVHREAVCVSKFWLVRDSPKSVRTRPKPVRTRPKPVRISPKLSKSWSKSRRLLGRSNKLRRR